jgi:hypothetical protein
MVYLYFYFTTIPIFVKHFLRAVPPAFHYTNYAKLILRKVDQNRRSFLPHGYFADASRRRDNSAMHGIFGKRRFSSIFGFASP